MLLFWGGWLNCMTRYGLGDVWRGLSFSLSGEGGRFLLCVPLIDRVSEFVQSISGWLRLFGWDPIKAYKFLVKQGVIGKVITRKNN